MNAMGGADVIGAAREKIVVDPMVTKVTLASDAIRIVKFDRIIWAG